MVSHKNWRTLIFLFLFIHNAYRFETSAKSNVGIDDAAKCLVGKILEDSKISQPDGRKKQDVIVPDGKPAPQKQQESDCC